MKTSGKSISIPIATLVFASLACNLLTGGSPPDDGADVTIESPTVVSVIEPTTTTESTPAPTPEPTLSIALGQEYRSAPGGFAFYELPGWEVIDEGEFLVHQSTGADPDLGPAFLMNSQLFENDTTPDAAFDTYLSDFGDSVAFGTPADTIVAGVPARFADLTGSADDGTRMAGQVLVALAGPRHAFYLFGFAPESEWNEYAADYFQAFTGSLSFFAPTEVANPPPDGSGDVLRQWAIFAFASSEYTDTSWSALQATGAPDVYPDCGDIAEAWAPQEYGTSDWLELAFETPVYATEVNIYESYNPGQIVAVDLLDTDGTPYAVYTADPEIMSDCGSILTVYPELNVPVTGVVIYVNTVLVNDWTEIDAVELVGIPAGP